jgi:hypothetical protein
MLERVFVFACEMFVRSKGHLQQSKAAGFTHEITVCLHNRLLGGGQLVVRGSRLRRCLSVVGFECAVVNEGCLGENLVCGGDFAHGAEHVADGAETVGDVRVFVAEAGAVALQALAE